MRGTAPKRGSCRNGASSARLESSAFSPIQDAAKELVGRVGQSQQRLSRAREDRPCPAPVDERHPRRRRGARGLGQRATRSTTSPTRSLRVTCARRSLAEELESYGERPSRRRVPRSCGACARCTAPPRCSSQGCPSRRGDEALKAPPWLQRRPSRALRGRSPDARARALRDFTDLEVEMRGGAGLQLDEDTAFSLMLAAQPPDRGARVQMRRARPLAPGATLGLARSGAGRPPHRPGRSCGGDPCRVGGEYARPHCPLSPSYAPGGTRRTTGSAESLEAPEPDSEAEVARAMGVPPLLRRDLRLDADVLRVLERLRPPGRTRAQGRTAHTPNGPAWCPLAGR